jgi:hypothetical protein
LAELVQEARFSHARFGGEIDDPELRASLSKRALKYFQFARQGATRFEAVVSGGLSAFVGH